MSLVCHGARRPILRAPPAQIMVTGTEDHAEMGGEGDGLTQSLLPAAHGDEGVGHDVERGQSESGQEAVDDKLRSKLKTAYALSWCGMQHGAAGLAKPGAR